MINNVAIAIPDTGLLLLPTNPTIREETVAKKNPKITMMTAPKTPIGMTGSAAIKMIKIASIPSTTPIFRSRFVRSSLPIFSLLKIPFIASAKVRQINGNDLIKLIIPPAATAPAPI